MIASDCFFRMWVVSRGMVSPGVVLVYRFGSNVVLRVHILVLKVGPCLFYGPTSVLSQCTNLLPILWLPCICLLVLLPGLRHALPPNILLQNHWLTRWSLLVGCCVSVVQGFFFGGGIHTTIGVLPGNNVPSVLFGGFHTFPFLPVWRCIHCVLFLWDYIFPQIPVVSLKSESWFILPCPSGCSGKNISRPCTCTSILRLRWRFLHGVLWWSSLMFVCWLLLDNL